jgi:outer membrane protein TolC
LFIALLACGQAAWAGALSYARALELAQQTAPQAQMAQANLAAARAQAIPAGALPDPKLALALDNFPISGPTRNSLTADFMTMRRIGISQDVPNQDKRAARVAGALARIEQSEATQRATWRMLRLEAAKAWLKRYNIEQQLAQIAQLQAENQRFAKVVQAQLTSGRGAASDSILPRQEAAMLDERREELETRRTIALASLRRWIGAAADDNLEGKPPQWQLNKDKFEHDLPSHPEVQVNQAMTRALAAELAEARADKKPDWGVELAYQQRGSQFGDMISVQFNIGLPLWPGQRQDPKIAAKAAERSALEQEGAAMRAEHVQKLTQDWAELEHIGHAIDRTRRVFQPLAQQKVELTLAAYQSGKGLLLEVMTARREALEWQLKQIMQEGEQDLLAAQILLTYQNESGGQP